MNQTAHMFALGEAVKIVDLEVIAKVRIIQISMDGIAYKVSFYMDGERKEEWVYDDELQGAGNDHPQRQR